MGSVHAKVRRRHRDVDTRRRSSVHAIHSTNLSVEVISSSCVKKGIVVGWGQGEDKTRFFQPVPKQLEVPIHTNEDCYLKNSKLADIASKRTFCPGSADGSGVCLGDSGHGLFVQHEDAFFLRGIVSSSLIIGQTCDVINYAIYTNVLKFKYWIDATMFGEFHQFHREFVDSSIIYF